MRSLTEAKAQELLADHLAAIRGIVQGGWNDYHSEYSEKSRLIHTSRTRASLVHDHQVARAQTYAFENQFNGVRS